MSRARRGLRRADLVVGERRAARRRARDGRAVGRRLRPRDGGADRRAFRALPRRRARRLPGRRRVQWGAVTPDLASLRALLSDGSVSTDASDLAAHAHDWWTLALLRQRRGDTVILPAAVVRPASTEEVSATLHWAQETRTPVVPFGGGSGVSGGVEAVAGSIALDTRRMNALLAVDGVALTVTAQAGIGGAALEDGLAGRGLTLGHFPQSIDIS
ncbi:MAG: FAD-binding oxidoreductase, partial [Actinobacteria bacterium]